MADRRRTIGAVARGENDQADLIQTIEAREDLARRLEAEFDLELLEEAERRVRQRVAPQTWEAYRLTAIEGLSGAEAAARLGMKVTAVFVSRSNVTKQLQSEVRDLEAHPDASLDQNEVGEQPAERGSKMDPCLSSEQLECLLDEHLDDRQQQAVEDHVEGCATCQQTLEELAVARNDARVRSRLTPDPVRGRPRGRLPAIHQGPGPSTRAGSSR